MRLTVPAQPRRLVALFLVATLLPSIALIWLGWTLVRQDAELERQRVRDAADRAAVTLAAGLTRELATIDRELPALASAGDGRLPRDAAIALRLTRDRVDQESGAPLLYLPHAPPPEEASSSSTWLEIERLEFGSDRASAIARYRELAKSTDLDLRAGSLVRLARALVGTGRVRDALASYDELASLPSARVSGDPAELVARWGRLALLEQRNESTEAAQSAQALAADLTGGKWLLDETSFRTYADLLSQWTPAAQQSSTALTDAVGEIWSAWTSGTPDALTMTGRRLVASAGESILVVWRSDPTGLLVFAARPSFLGSAWPSVWPGPNYLVSLTDEDSGLLAFGSNSGGADATAVRLPSSETGLPWTIRLSAASTPIEVTDALRTRQRLILAGLALVAFLLPASAFLVVRTVQRELAVARQQSDFVSAVSHELRSPLTTLTHLTSLLRGDFTPSDSRRGQYYDMLARETDRLRRFVDALLDFGRMQAGRASYRFDDVDVATFVEGVVADFRGDAASAGHTLATNVSPELPPISGDEVALSRALWNLMENASKYSPAGCAVTVDAGLAGDLVAIRVSDRGAGIPVNEQALVFDQFFRGASATRSAVPGTGVGLAVVRHIVRSHGGDVSVESVPGSGSTFSILLPTSGRMPDRQARKVS